MESLNFFEFFEIPVSFYPDEADLKQRYLRNSKKFHPDFHTLSSEDLQTENLELSTLNNQAFLVLNNFDKRLKYILDLHGMLAEEGKNELDQGFLLEMMEINEAIMELEFDFDQNHYDGLRRQVNALELDLRKKVEPYLLSFDPSSPSLLPVKDFFLKNRYIWRIKENLDKFAPASREER